MSGSPRRLLSPGPHRTRRDLDRVLAELDALRLHRDLVEPITQHQETPVLP
jgi:hypothetical protein